MGKKIRSEMQAQRERFVEARIEHGVERSQAELIFELLERFADYGFNKSHARGLRAGRLPDRLHEGELSGRVPRRVDDARHRQYRQARRSSAPRRSGSASRSMPPSVNRSGVAFEVDGDTIHYSLAALKGVGTQAVEAIVAARGDRPFTDLSDFATPHQSARGQQARAGKSRRCRRLRRA